MRLLPITLITACVLAAHGPTVPPDPWDVRAHRVQQSHKVQDTIAILDQIKHFIFG